MDQCEVLTMLKEFIPFIDKDRYLVIQLFEFLKYNHQESYSLSEIQNQLQISVYKTKSVIHDAMILSEKIPHTQLAFHDDTLTTSNITNTVLNTVVNLEANASLRFKLFLHTTLNIYHVSDKEFQENEGISSSTYFRIKKNLKQEIGTKKINSMNKSEVFSRYYIYQLLVYFSYFDYSPDFLSDNKKILKAKNSISYATILWKITFSQSQRKQINYFIFVSLLRSKNQMHLKNTNENFLIEITNKNEINLFIKHLTKEWYMLPSDAVLVTRYCISFLINTNNLPISNLDFLKDFKTIKDTTQKQINILNKMTTTTLSENEINDFKDKLLQTNAKLLSPFFTADLFLTEQHLDYNDLWINKLIDRIICELANVLCTVSLVKYNTAEVTQIKKAYFMIVSPVISLHHLNLPIHIVVDFSDGDITNDYVKSYLHVLDDLNIQIDRHIDDVTDIYLTDTYNHNFKKHQVIWKDLPKGIDYDSLRNFIVDLKKNISNNFDSMDQNE